MTFRHIVCVIFLGLFIVLSGCSATGVSIQGQEGPKYRKSGPPPHAPAHGYRHKHHDGHQLEYNTRIGVYVVVNMPETYFGNNLYIRMSSDGNWLVSTRLGKGWRPASRGEVPYQLRSYYDNNRSGHPGKHKKQKFKD
jgi:hypothetical protein